MTPRRWNGSSRGSVRCSASGTIETDRWVMFRGDPQRNATSPGSAPLLNMRWEVPAAADPAVEEALEGIIA